jgi:hypothetical protein
MSANIDLSKGGYQGDPIEEMFKPFTSAYMSYWWHFREVLRASHAASSNWKKSDGSALSDEEQKQLAALSLINYAVYTSIGEALSFLDQMAAALIAEMPSSNRIFQVRAAWKAAYSSLYTSFNALCNIVYVIVGHNSPFGNKPGRIWNATPADAYNLTNGRALKELYEPIGRCKGRLEIRDHLDHYWTIWVSISQGRFLFDENFSKGYVPIRPESDVAAKIDAIKRTEDDIVEMAKDFNLIYEKLAVANGYFDSYLQAKGWEIEYSDYGEPHKGQRPRP